MSYYSPAARRFLEAFNEDSSREPAFAGVRLDFDERRPGTVEIRGITVPGSRGEGRGSAALRRTCEIADQAGVSLYVQPHSHIPGVTARLRAWYIREGFTEEVEEGRLVRPAPLRPHDLTASDVAAWALAHGFRATGSNAYSAMHEGDEYQMLLRRDLLQVQRKRDGRVLDVYARCEYRNLRIDEHGMLLHAGLCEAFVRRMQDGGAPPVWFPESYTAHARETIIPEWEAKIADMTPALRAR